MRWKSTLSPIKKVRVYHLWLKTKNTFWRRSRPAAVLYLLVTYAFLFGASPTPCDPGGVVTHVTHYFLRAGWALDMHREWWAENLPSLICHVCIRSVSHPPTMSDSTAPIWRHWMWPWGKEHGLGWAELIQAHALKSLPTGPSWYTLYPSGHRDWSRVKYVNPDNTDKHHCRALEQKLGRGCYVFPWVKAVRNMWAPWYWAPPPLLPSNESVREHKARGWWAQS